MGDGYYTFFEVEIFVELLNKLKFETFIFELLHTQ